MAIITLQGKEVHTNGELPANGSQAPDFRLTNHELEDLTLESFPGSKKLISIVPSLDTPVCATSTKRFDTAAARQEHAKILVVSADLPFAMHRFCDAEGLEDVVALSMMRSRDFARDYGVLIEDGPLAGITARAVVVLDEHNQVLHGELVGEISDEPDYESALAALQDG